MTGKGCGEVELRTLRYFVAVLEAGSLSRAASLLYVAQPALTAQIKKLEQELSTQLFERSYAGVTPTAAGMQLYQDACKLLSDANAMQERLQRSPDGPEGSVTVAIPFLLSSLLMGPVLFRLKKAYPRIRVFVIDGLSLTVRKAMLDRRADIGILVDTAELADLDVRPFACEAMYVCGFDKEGEIAALTQAQAKSGVEPEVPFSKAAALPLVLQSRRFSIRSRVEETAADMGIDLNIEHEYDSARIIRSLYLAGAGFTFTPACALADGPKNDGHWMAARVMEPELLRRYFLALPRTQEPSSATLAVLEALVDEARSMIDAGRWKAEFLFKQKTPPKSSKRSSQV